MSDKVKIGAVVQLKSGGPKMAVFGFEGTIGGGASGNVICQWFAWSGDGRSSFQDELREGIFHPDGLD